jgi:hypothetical protein
LRHNKPVTAYIEISGIVRTAVAVSPIALFSKRSQDQQGTKKSSGEQQTSPALLASVYIRFIV